MTEAVLEAHLTATVI